MSSEVTHEPVSTDLENAEEAVDYAETIIARAMAETSGPHVLATACYVVLRGLAEQAGISSEQMFLRMAQRFRKVS